MQKEDNSRRIRVCVSTILICLVIALSGFAQERQETPQVHTGISPDTLFNEIRLELIGKVQSGALPSLGVGVIDDGKVVWEEVIGWADADSGVAATPHTLYGLASVGKSVTATGVMALVEQGRVKLDDPVQRYISPDSLTVHEGNVSEVTVRQLLNMTAAIPHGNLDFVFEKDAVAYTTADIVRKRGIVVFPPGEMFLYSNCSYGVLENLIERVTEMSFSSFLEKEVFARVGMQRARVGRLDHSSGLAATRYDENGDRLDPVYPIPQSSRSILASVHDLIGYAKFHLKYRPDVEQMIISDELLDIMHRERPPLPQSIMALGWGSIDLGDGSLWLLTNGRDGGAQATVSLVPSRTLAVICVTNKTGNETDGIAFRITERLIPGFLDRVERRIAEWEAWANRSFEPTPELLGDWEGTILTRNGSVQITLVFHSNGEISAELEGQKQVFLSDIRLEQGLLSGRFDGKLELEETAEGAHQIHLALLHKSGRLFGHVTATFTNDRGSFMLPAYVSLIPKNSKSP